MAARNALIVDDEAHIRELIELTLIPLGVNCYTAETVSEARAVLEKHELSFCITDMRLPDGDGLQLVSHIQKHYSDVPVAVITAYGNVETAVEALKLGAFDFVAKPFEVKVLRSLVTAALKLAPDAGFLDDSNMPKMLGHSSAMDLVRTLIRKLGRSQAPVLITGESGTGKELAARAIHASGPRADRAFVPVNCGAIPEHLLESEFFGYKKGSFTGATQDKTGLFQAAHNGTLFLDEIAELPQHMQVKLLRAIQERAVRQIGSQTETPVDVRILSATHQDLAQLVENGEFRQDLYYRVNVIEMRMPSLRERAEDIAELAEHVLERLDQGQGAKRHRLSKSASIALESYPFPGNVRELENVLERALTLCEGSTITPEDLLLPDEVLHIPSTQAKSVAAAGAVDAPADGGGDSVVPGASIPKPTEAGLETYLEELERDAITKALEATRYNKTAAAEKLGISFRALRYRLKKLGLE